MKKSHKPLKNGSIPHPQTKLERRMQSFAKAMQLLQDEYEVDLIAQPRMSQSGQGVWGVAAIIVAQPRQPQQQQ